MSSMFTLKSSHLVHGLSNFDIKTLYLTTGILTVYLPSFVDSLPSCVLLVFNSDLILALTEIDGKVFFSSPHYFWNIVNNKDDINRLIERK